MTLRHDSLYGPETRYKPTLHKSYWHDDRDKCPKNLLVSDFKDISHTTKSRHQRTNSQKIQAVLRHAYDWHFKPRTEKTVDAAVSHAVKV
jgi:hypothetical protein